MNDSRLNIADNRSARKWTRRELGMRVLWRAAQPLFRWSPRLLWGWRCILLRAFGAKIGRNVQIHPSVRIFIPWNLEVGDWTSIGFDVLIYNLGPIKVGRNVTISQRAHLCGGTHDFCDAAMPLIKCPIAIGDEAWICADVFVGPGVSVGRGVVVGARAVVVKDVGERAVVAGNPAKVVGLRTMHDFANAASDNPERAGQERNR